MQLNEIPHIQLHVDITLGRMLTESDWNNYFRIYKSPDESLEDDCFCSPFFDSGRVYVLGNDYTNREIARDAIMKHFQTECIEVCMRYDFLRTPVNVPYELQDGEDYRQVGLMLEEALAGTNLSFGFFVSHFNQFANKSGVLKPEHYHVIIIGNTDDFDCGINQFVNNLSKQKIIGRIKIHEIER